MAAILFLSCSTCRMPLIRDRVTELHLSRSEHYEMNKSQRQDIPRVFFARVGLSGCIVRS